MSQSNLLSDGDLPGIAFAFGLTLAFTFAIIMVFLILSANYERWSLPAAVLLAVPFGLLGALSAVFLRNFSNDVYFQIGLLVLIGLAAKNAILIVEFAAQEEAKGLSPIDAALEAARLQGGRRAGPPRFRMKIEN